MELTRQGPPLWVEKGKKWPKKVRFLLSQSVDGEGWQQSHVNNFGPNHTHLPAVVNTWHLPPSSFLLSSCQRLLHKKLIEGAWLLLHHENIHSGAKSWLPRLTPVPKPQMNGTMGSFPPPPRPQYIWFLVSVTSRFLYDTTSFLLLVVLSLKFHISCQLLSDAFCNFFNIRTTLLYAKEAFLTTWNNLHKSRSISPYKSKRVTSTSIYQLACGGCHTVTA